MNFINDGLRAKYIVSQDYDEANNVHSSLKPGYFLTNEYLDYISKFDINNKKVLSVCGSGDHAFMSLLNGASVVDTFDSNPFQFYITELKRAAIICLSKEEYLNFFPLEGGNINENYNIKYYKKVRDLLSDDIKQFWDLVYSADKPCIYLLSMFSYPLKFESNYTRKYDELQRNLVDKKINYIPCDLFNVINQVEGDYSLILLSNIFDHLNNHDYKYDEKKYLEFIKECILPLLSDDGVCVLHYQFGNLRNIGQSNFDECESMKCGYGDSIKYLRKK